MVRKFSKVLALVLVLVFGLSACSGGSTGPQQTSGTGGDEKFTIKICWNTSDNEADPYAIAAREFKKAAEEKSEGRITVELYPNEQLGKERDVLEGMSMGTIDMSVMTNAPISGFVPQFQVLDLPFIFQDRAQAYEVLDGPLGKELLELLKSKNIIGLGFAEGGFRQMINNVRAVNQPSDVEGVKYRVMENPVYIGMFKYLGSNPTPMSWGETFTAVQQKTIDGLEIPIPVIHQNKYYEVCKYLSLTNHTYSPLVMMISKSTWDKLPSDLQSVVQESVTIAVTNQRKKNAENEAALLEDLKAKGMEINEVANLGAFKEKVTPLYLEFEDEIGKELLDKFL
ncbi:MAG TPA: DctP family TRAP transporter solute-binding subunit [Clostridiales bacterium]|nr:DctP family TRAP transporter solute-binding subunit [Clostridiales bacterium]